MKNATRSCPRPWLAVLVALLCNGLSHLYAGRALAGLVIQAVWLAAGVALVLALRFGPGFAVGACAAALAFWTSQAAVAGRAARAATERPPAGWLARPLGLVTFYLATFLVAAALGEVVQPRTVQTFAMASRSMMPTLHTGDWLVVLPGAPIERGAVVAHAAPPSAPSKAPLLKREGCSRTSGTSSALCSGSRPSSSSGLARNGAGSAGRVAGPVSRFFSLLMQAGIAA